MDRLEIIYSTVKLRHLAPPKLPVCGSRLLPAIAA
jgi:hypothetical protein